MLINILALWICENSLNFTRNLPRMDISFQLQHEELDLISACIKRERWAQKKLYEDNYSRMMAVCARYATNDEDAMDILHEGFLKVFKNITKYQPGTSLTAWIRRIMINTSIDYYRQQMRRRTESIDQAYELSTNEPDAVSQFTEREILSAVQRLTPAYRVIFNMYVIEGFSHKEIAEQLNITESTSRSNLVKARLKLREILVGKTVSDTISINSDEA
jgi:RNA polymerase sigma factor (sigma-70 family)